MKKAVLSGLRFWVCLGITFIASFQFLLPMPAVASGTTVKLSLSQALSMALERNEDIQESFRRIPVAEASVMASKGEYDLNTFATARYGRFNSLSTSDYGPTDLTNAARSYGRLDTGLRQRVPTGGTLSAYYTYSNERRIGAFGQGRNFDKNYVTLEFAQSLLKGIGDKEVRGAIESAMLAVKDSEEGRSLVVSQVSLEVVRAYWILDMAQNNLAVSKEILQMAKEVLRREEVRLSQGISQGVDVDRALMAVKQREYTVLQYERDAAVAQERLALLLNYPNYSNRVKFVPVTTLKTVVEKLPDEQASFNLAMQNRYELKQLAILLQQLGIEYDVNTNKLLPVLDVNVGVTTSHGNDYLRSGENFKDTDEQGSWFAGLTVTFPLQNREARGNVRKTEQMIRIANDRIHKMGRNVQTEVRETLHNLVLARDGIVVAQKAYESAQQTVRGELKRFEMGGVNNRDLLASHDSLGKEKINYHMAVVNYNISVAEYNYACATLMDKYLIRVSKDKAWIQ